MKFKRIVAMPFTLLADVVTLGNMGDRSFTQQLMDAERNEREQEAIVAVISALLGKEK